MFLHLSTEKLWRSFYIGSVPIVYGSAKSKEIFPSEKSAIEILDFKSAKELADFIHRLNQNDTEYDEYLTFKKKNGVTNKVLVDLLSKRGWGINNDRIRGSYIDHFECMVCNQLHENVEKRKRGEAIVPKQASKEHYGCPKPYTFSEEGVLLEDSYKNKPAWKESTFVTSYEISNAEQKIFFEKYYSENNFNFTYKSLRKEALDYHFKSVKNSLAKKNDLK
jgi:alpha-1,3-fucosyltransferase 10